MAKKLLLRIIMKVLKFVVLVLAVSVMSIPSRSNADAILVNEGDESTQIQIADPFGQSFTAEDPFVLFAFSFFDVNQQGNENLPLMMCLLEGDGVDGTELASISQTLPEDLGSVFGGEFVDFDFSSVALVVGQQYTVLIKAPSDRWGVDHNDANLYDGGTMFIGGEPRGEMRFRVTPTTASVPEPSSLAFAVVAVISGLMRRRRTTLAQTE